jgi:ABC-type oligopeptide transport system substrate-binding subunit
VREAGKHEIEIKLRKPLIGFLRILGESAYTIVKQCPGPKQICFSGDFKLGNYDETFQDIIRIKDRVIFRFKRVAFDKALSEFKSGRIHILRSYGLTDLHAMIKLDGPKLISADERTYFFAFNTKSPYLSTVSSRKAFVSQFDIGGLTRQLQQIEQQYSASFISPSLSMGRMETSTKQLSPSKLRSHRFQVLSIKTQGMENIIKATFTNINHTIRDVDKKSFIDQLVKGDYDVIAVGYGSTLTDFNALSTFFHKDSMHNTANGSDQNMTALVEKLWLNEKPAKRLNIVKEILDKNNELVWYWPITHTPVIYAIKSDLSIENTKIKDGLNQISYANLDLNQVIVK